MAGLSPNKKQSTIFYKGFGMIEAVVGVTLASILLTAFMTLTVQTVKINRANINELKADMYLKELIEVAKDLEQTQEGWNTITSASCPCHPDISGNKWILEEPAEPLENNFYSRWIIIEDVCRDSDNKIIGCGYLDTPATNTKKVIATITWNDGFKDASSTLETYIYNYNTP